MNVSRTMKVRQTQDHQASKSVELVDWQRNVDGEVEGLLDDRWARQVALGTKVTVQPRAGCIGGPFKTVILPLSLAFMAAAQLKLVLKSKSATYDTVASRRRWAFSPIR